MIFNKAKGRITIHDRCDTTEDTRNYVSKACLTTSEGTNNDCHEIVVAPKAYFGVHCLALVLRKDKRVKGELANQSASRAAQRQELSYPD